MTRGSDPFRRARRWFWGLVLVAVLAMGALYAALGAQPGPGTGLAVGASTLLLLAAGAQATRIMLTLDRARKSAMTDPESPALPRRPAPAAGTVARLPAGTMADRLLGRRAQATGERPPTR